MKKKAWLNNITQGKGKEIAKHFFLTFTTQERVSKLMGYNRKKKAKGESKRKPKSKQQKTHYVEPIVNIRSNDWDKLGFLEQSKPIPFKDKWDRQQYVYWKIMNLEPIYKFCKEYKKIEFSEEEKSYLKLLLLSEKIREEILKEYPEEDIISSTLKFYIKNLIMRYSFLLKDIRENPKKYKKEIAKAEELNSPLHPFRKTYDKLQKEIHKKYAQDKKYKKIDFDIIKIVAMNEWHKDLKNPIRFIFNSYITEIQENKELVASTDRKILSAFNLQP